MPSRGFLAQLRRPPARALIALTGIWALFAAVAPLTAVDPERVRE